MARPAAIDGAGTVATASTFSPKAGGHAAMNATKTADDYNRIGVYCEAIVPFRVGCDTIEAEQEAMPP